MIRISLTTPSDNFDLERFKTEMRSLITTKFPMITYMEVEEE